MQLDILRPHRNIENNEKQYDEIYDWWHVIWWKRSDCWKQGRNIEYRYRSLETAKNEFAENIDYLEKEYDERNQMDMSYYKDSDERDQIS